MHGLKPARLSHSPAGNPIPGGRFLFRHFRILVPALLLLCCALRPASAFDTATVLEVVDGDTIRVRTGGAVATVRLIGIDTPERGHPSRPKEFIADEAAEALSAMCGGKPVRLEKEIEEADKYGRILRYVFSGDGRQLFNRELVRKGVARVYRRFPFSRQPEFEAAETLARKEGLGLWRNGGLDELRWVRLQKHEPVTVWPLGGGEYGVEHGGMGKAGIGPNEVGSEIAKITRIRIERSDADFVPEALKAGYGPIAGEDGDTPGSRTVARQAPETGVVSWENAREYLGQSITVEGTVLRAKRSRKTVFLNFHTNWKRYLTVVLFTGKMPGLPNSPETFYRGKRVRVRGTVKLYKDRPEIVVENADGIRVVP